MWNNWKQQKIEIPMVIVWQVLEGKVDERQRDNALRKICQLVAHFLNMINT